MKLEVKPSGTVGGHGEEFWFIQDEKISWCYRWELEEKLDSVLAALKREGYTVTREQVQNILIQYPSGVSVKSTDNKKTYGVDASEGKGIDTTAYEKEYSAQPQIGESSS